MSKDEINRIETLAASFFENSEDIQIVSFSIQQRIEARLKYRKDLENETRLALRRKQELEMKS